MRFVIVLSVVLVGWLAAASHAEEQIPIPPHYLMDRDPPEQAHEVVWHLNPLLLPLWKQAIAHPESELQRQAAVAIAQAHQLGHEGLDTFRPELLALLKSEGIHPATRYAAAKALIVLESRDSAADLFAVSQREGKDLRQLVEPALARWGYEPIRAVWAGRIALPTTPRRDLLLAIQGLAQARITSAHPDLLNIALDPSRPVDIRLAAARAAGETAEKGLEPSATALFTRGTLIDRLCAAALLIRHRSPESVSLNQTLALDPEPAVCGMALRTLFESDPQLVLPVTEASLISADANVRKVAIETYLKLPTVERLETLSAHLSDPHPDLRGMVRDGFFTHSHNPTFESGIRASTIRALGGHDWRGQEQAALLLAALDRKEVAPRLVELLESDRDEVMIATAWALRMLAVPETAPAITDKVRRQSERETYSLHGPTHQVAHLCEALGQLRYTPAIPVLRIYVPKTQKYNERSRSGAIWGLSRMFEDAAAPPSPTPLPESDRRLAEELAAQFMGRVRESSGMPPEWPMVRRVSALAIGRMRAASQIPGLKEMIGTEVDSEPIDLAMRWSVLRISGENLPIALPASAERTGWFMEPAPTKSDDVKPKSK